jgi:hypothetical protein
MVLIVGAIIIKPMKPYTLLNLIKSYGSAYLTLFFLCLCSNLAKVQAQSVPLNYEIPEDGLEIPVNSPDEPSNTDVEDPLQPNFNNSGEPIMIFVPPPENRGEVSKRRRNLSDILVIEPMLLPPNSKNPY